MDEKEKLNHEKNEMDMEEQNEINNNKDEESKEKEEKKEEEKKEEEKKEEENKIKEKINSVPIMMRCFLCEDYCEEATQIICCNEIFCKKHITEEIMKKFECPKCHKKCGLNNLVENKKLGDDIKWFKKILNELLENERNHNS